MCWSNRNSIFLTKIVLLIFAAGYLAVVLTCPLLTDCFVRLSFLAAGISKWLFAATIYAAAVPVGLLLWELWQLLWDIGLEEIFTGDNVRRLRIISWMCFLAALICLLSMLYYVFWGILSACLFFMGLLIRVIKNTFQEAKELKEEADFTI